MNFLPSYIMFTCSPVVLGRFVRSARRVQTDLQAGNVLHIYLHSQFLFIKSDTCLASWQLFPWIRFVTSHQFMESGASSWYAMGGSPSHPKSTAIAPIHRHTAVLHDRRIIYMKHHYMQQLPSTDYNLYKPT